MGTLVEVNAREAWQHEAHNFTPWLAENLDRLSDAIGVPLELVGKEVAVDNFFADILARNSGDGTMVLIENQLEGSDHGHLGQILTYLAGLEAQTVVWVATGFQDAHLSAINWLNEHTDDSFAFFAVRTKVVRIGDSPFAPVFEVLSRPNDWERRLQRTAKESRALSEIGKTRQEFWTAFLTRYPEEVSHGAANADSYRWHVLPDLELVIVIYLAQDEVGVYVRGLRAVDDAVIAARLEPIADRLAQQLDASPNGRFMFKKAKKGDAMDPNARGSLMNWLNTTAQHYDTTLHAVLGIQD